MHAAENCVIDLCYNYNNIKWNVLYIFNKKKIFQAK